MERVDSASTGMASLVEMYEEQSDEETSPHVPSAVDNISDEEIVKLNIPTGVPLVYELDENFKAVKNYYLGDADEVAKAAEAVAKQGKA